MEIIYKNQFGDTIRKQVETFAFRGTIMNERVQEIGDCVMHRLWVEDSEGGKVVVVWNSAKGYDREKLRVGKSAYFKGIIHANGYIDSEGNEKVYKEYSAQEIS